MTDFQTRLREQSARLSSKLSDAEREALRAYFGVSRPLTERLLRHRVKFELDDGGEVELLSEGEFGVEEVR